MKHQRISRISKTRSIIYGLYSPSLFLRFAVLFLFIFTHLFLFIFQGSEVHSLSQLERYGNFLQESSYEIILFGNSTNPAKTNTYFDGRNAFRHLFINPALGSDILIETEQGEYGGNYFNNALINGRWQPYPKLGPNQVVISENVARKFLLSIGDPITIINLDNQSPLVTYDISYITQAHYGFEQISLVQSEGLLIFGYNQALIETFPQFALPFYGNIAFRSLADRADFLYPSNKLNILKDHPPAGFDISGLTFIEPINQLDSIRNRIENFRVEVNEFYLLMISILFVSIHFLEARDFTHLKSNYRYQLLESFTFTFSRNILTTIGYSFLLGLSFITTFLLGSNDFIQSIFIDWILLLLMYLFIYSIFFSILRLSNFRNLIAKVKGISHRGQQ